MGYLLMLLSAFGLGAAHALEPGHGKTIVAAYLVGSRGRAIDAVILGGIVTLTHTASVFVLAIAATVAAAHFVPDQVQRWFAIVSGVLVVTVGIWMIYSRTRYGPPTQSHSHGSRPHSPLLHGHAGANQECRHSDEADGAEMHAHPQPHGDRHEHLHPSDGARESGVRLGSLAALGVSGGIVPCPAALLLIPAAVGLGAVLKGLLLVVSFSLGLDRHPEGGRPGR
jgi:nickel/cobalt exporter